MRKRFVWPVACLVMGGSLVCCAGGGGELAILASTIISGVAAIGPLIGGIGTIYALDQSGATGAPLASMTTGPKGAFTADIGTYHGNILATVTGGNYTNPVTLLQVTNPMPLRAAVPNVSGSTWVSVTPLTEIATQTAGTLTPGNITAADTLVTNMIGGIDILTTKPSDVTDPAAALNTASEKNYGLMLAAVSQMVAQGTSGSVTEAISKIKNDISDNYQLDATGPEISAALEKFIPSPNNKTGLTMATAAIVPSIHEATIAPIKNPLVGSWVVRNATTPLAVLTFVDNSNFFFGQDGVANGGGQAGMERGTYAWNLTNWTPTVIVDTNGRWGLSDASGTQVPYSISNNILALGDAQAAKLMPSASNPLVGSWNLMNGAGQSNGNAVFTFLDDANYVFVGDGESVPSGLPGIERGTYTRTATEITVTPTVDTNGQGGFSDPSQPNTPIPYTLSGDVLTFPDPPNPDVHFTRVK